MTSGLLEGFAGGTHIRAAADPGRRRIARLFRRVAFGATVEEVDEWAARGYEAAVDSLLGFPPAATRADEAEVIALESALFADRGGGFGPIGVVQRWWLNRMAITSHPLEEKLTLYWHGHFASAYSKVDRLGLLARQNRLLRDHAGGNFRQLAKLVTADAAMLLYLDGATNHAGRPNENYGREFMELFTLGKDRYSQADVREAARAFTGYTVDGLGNVAFDPALHDTGPKTLLGNTGAFGPDDVADIVLDRHPEGPVAARYIARRLAGFLHRPDPEPAAVDAMATAFADSGYEIKPMVRALLLRPEFTDGPVLTIASPAEVVASTMRALGLAVEPGSVELRRGDEFAAAASAMGQQLFNPPNVAGWKGGGAWANTATTLGRYNFAARAAEMASGQLVSTVLDGVGGIPRDTTGPWMDRLGLIELFPATEAAIAGYVEGSRGAGSDPAIVARGVLTLLLASPDYHLR